MPYVTTARDRKVLRLLGQSSSRLGVVPAPVFYGFGQGDGGNTFCPSEEAVQSICQNYVQRCNDGDEEACAAVLMTSPVACPDCPVPEPCPECLTPAPCPECPTCPGAPVNTTPGGRAEYSFRSALWIGALSFVGGIVLGVFAGSEVGSGKRKG